MADTTATVEEDFLTTASLASTISTSSNLEDLANIDSSTYGLRSGSVLVFNQTTGNWVTTIKLEEQDITGGQY
jgi:hypothetical protein